MISLSDIYSLRFSTPRARDDKVDKAGSLRGMLGAATEVMGCGSLLIVRLLWVRSLA
jgi:hypothetical protein